MTQQITVGNRQDFYNLNAGPLTLNIKLVELHSDLFLNFQFTDCTKTIKGNSREENKPILTLDFLNNIPTCRNRHKTSLFVRKMAGHIANAKTSKSPRYSTYL